MIKIVLSIPVINQQHVQSKIPKARYRIQLSTIYHFIRLKNPSNLNDYFFRTTLLVRLSFHSQFLVVVDSIAPLFVSILFYIRIDFFSKRIQLDGLSSMKWLFYIIICSILKLNQHKNCNIQGFARIKQHKSGTNVALQRRKVGKWVQCKLHFSVPLMYG